MEIDTHILDELDKFCSQRNLTLIGDCKTLKHGEPIDKFYVLINERRAYHHGVQQTLF